MALLARYRGGGVNVEIGDEIPAFRMERVSPERMKTVAAIFRDPFPVHWDREATRAMGFDGRLLNQSPINLGYVINMLAEPAAVGVRRRSGADAWGVAVGNATDVRDGSSIVFWDVLVGDLKLAPGQTLLVEL